MDTSDRSDALDRLTHDEIISLAEAAELVESGDIDADDLRVGTRDGRRCVYLA